MRLYLGVFFLLLIGHIEATREVDEENEATDKKCPCKVYARGACVVYEDCHQAEPEERPMFKSATGPKCSRVLIRDTGYQELDGVYDALSSPQNDCSGRLSYSQVVANETFYLYVVRGVWVVGLVRCNDTNEVIMRAGNAADFPWTVANGTWQVYQAGQLVTNPRTKALCAMVNCNTVELSGALYQASREGIYSRVPGEMCFGRPVFRHSSGQNYLYFFQGSSRNIWLVGPTKCNSQAGLRVDDGAYAPDGIINAWQEYETASRTWKTSPALKARCPGAPPPPGSATTAPSTLPPTACTRIAMLGFTFQSNRAGVYDLVQGEACFGRPVYMHTSASNYLYFYEGASSRLWLIGPKKCENTAGVRARDSAHSPNEVTASWEEYDRNSGAWRPSPAARAVCNATRSSTSTTTGRTSTVTTLPPTDGPSRSILNCSFAVNLCGLTQSTDDDRNWVRHRGSTQSSSTGPDKAYDDDYYIYLETSNPAQAGDKALIYLDSLRGGRSVCVSFAYHMYGSDMGSLSVAVLYTESRRPQWRTVWSKSGDQRNQWYREHITIDVVEVGRHQLGWIAEKGTGYRSDMAVDAIDVREGRCPSGTTVTTPSTRTTTTTLSTTGTTVTRPKTRATTSIPSTTIPPRCDPVFQFTCRSIRQCIPRSLLCNGWPDCRDATDEVPPACNRFTTTTPHAASTPGPDETILSCRFRTDLCGMTQSSDDDRDWVRRSGPTPSGSTGPTRGVDDNYYIYFEGSSPVRAGDKALILYDPLQGGMSVCVSFAYHMYGSEMGSLSVVTQYTESRRPEWRTVWSRSGNQINLWHNAAITIDVPEAGRHKFGWLAEKGTGYRSDIALDNVRVSKGRCVSGTTVTRPSTRATSTPSPTIPTARCDPVFHFSCRYINQCIPRTLVCNGRPDCRDATDEGPPACPLTSTSTTRRRISTPTTRLPPPPPRPPCFRQFSCGGRICLPLQLVCNGRRECPDGSDEDYCTTQGPPTPTPTPELQKCSFESGLCGMEQSTMDQRDWTVKSGETGSSDTGPSGAKDGSFYIYLEANTPVVPNDTAIILSRPLRPIGPGCIHFWYHMYGRNMGSLTLILRQIRPGGTNIRKLWTISGDQGARWIEKSMEVNLLTTGVQVGWMATRGDDYRSDIALDDVSITGGRCSSGKVCPAGWILCPHGGGCIRSNWVCDRDRDCSDGWDESHCNYTCGTGEYSCGIGNCIPTSWKCDGDMDCEDGSDERCGTTTMSTTTRTTPGTCSSLQFRCASGTCIPMSYKCDSDNDCGDGSDELDCNTTCASSHFRCTSGNCIPFSWKCDNDNDCGDWSDERDCNATTWSTTVGTTPPGTCSSLQFRCASGTCIPMSRKCDGVNDCGDGGDERSCSTTCSSNQFRCTSGSCIAFGWKCDNDNDCGDWSDERDCNTTNPTSPSGCGASWRWQCANGACISKADYCDNKADCPDGSDESSCNATIGCQTGQFSCDQTRCIPSSMQCNMVSNCIDKTDEANCTCTRRNVNCASGACVAANSWCDGLLDCDDGSDEGAHCIRNHCAPGEVSCNGSRECVAVDRLCDTNKDCSNGADEINCTAQACRTGQWQCANGICVSDSDRCDGYKDCFDNSDEFNCTRCRGMSSTRCANGQCIRFSDRCDNYIDCADGSDEHNCFNTTGCDSDQLKCNDGVCLPRAYFCDGDLDCIDHSDEKECDHNLSVFTCKNGIPIARGRFCDGMRDCTDGSDELEKCSDSCFPEQHLCNGRCLSPSKVCNGVRDCPDASDEINCECGSHEFRCGSGECQSYKDHWCNGVVDCVDGSDEKIGCFNECPLRWSKCSSTPSGGTVECFTPTDACDGTNHCLMGEDERNCSGPKCSGKPCNNGTCLAEDAWCDGRQDCPGGEDESPGCENLCTTGSQFKCDDHCLNVRYQCDGVIDCADWADENGCNCNATQKMCANGRCLSIHQWCDGRDDCSDKSDETGALCECKYGHRCGDGICIPKPHQCDGVFDCDDRSDEFNCTGLGHHCESKHYVCNDGECIVKQWVCDGHDDCSEGEDESFCDACPQTHFQCRNYQCIDTVKRCDGRHDCTDGSDEQECAWLSDMVVSGNARVVEAYYGGGTNVYVACSTNWHTAFSDAVCYDIGYGPAVRTQFTPKRDGQKFVLIDLRLASNFTGSIMSVVTVGNCQDEVVALECAPRTCGHRPSVDKVATAFVVNGKKSVPNAWPWLASIQVPSRRFSPHICGATVIDNEWILTAAHCAIQTTMYGVVPGGPKAEMFRVVFGTSSLNVPGVIKTVKKVIVHESFTYSPLSTPPVNINDLAMMKLSSPLKYDDTIQPACLPKTPLHNASHAAMCVVAGWGSNRPSDIHIHHQMSEMKANILNGHLYCTKSLSQPDSRLLPFDDSRKICAGSWPNQASVCQGDSGGPLMCQNPKGGWTVVGAVSHGFGCDNPDIYTRVAHYLSWIQKTIRDN